MKLIKMVWKSGNSKVIIIPSDVDIEVGDWVEIDIKKVLKDGEKE
jgi:antitoxin component of MazEF toxin-antitoxin module